MIDRTDLEPCPLRLVSFGGLWIESADGTRIEGVENRRRALALLAAIASAGARGISRDRLLGLFWPESDDDRARNALKQSIFFLRRELEAPELFFGTSELRLNGNALASDVGEFLAAVERSEFERAAQLYRGPFLEGFYLRGSAEFDAWLEGERARIASLASGVYRRLAENSAAAGEHSKAAAWYSKLVALTPADSSATLGLVQALIAAGERAAALQQLVAHTSYVRRELGCEPSPAVAEITERLRDASPARGRSTPPDAPRPGTNARPHSEASDNSTIDSPALAGSRISRRTRWIGGFALVASAIALAVGIHTASGSHAVETRVVLLVAPFRVASNDPAVAFLSDGMVDLLSGALAGGAEGVHVVDPGLALKNRRLADSQVYSRSGRSVPSELRVAQSLGATRLVTGALLQSAGRVVLTATLTDVSTSRALGTVEVSARADSIPALVDRLAAGLIGLDAGEASQTVSVLTGTPILAVRAFIAGRNAFRNADYAGAIRFQESALGIDSTFALAAIDLGRSAGWLGDDDARLRAYKIAWRYRSRLGATDRAILTATLGPRYPAGSSRIEWLTAWEHVAEMEPDRPEGWFETGDLFFHNPWMAGGNVDNGLANARRLFERAMKKDSTYRPALQHLMQLAAHFRDTASVRALSIRAADRAVPSDLAAFLAWRAAFALGDPTALRTAWQRSQRANPVVMQWIVSTSEEDGLPLDDARRASDFLISTAATRAEKRDALLVAHALAANEGEFSRARALTAQLARTRENETIAAQLTLMDALFLPGSATDAVTEAAARLDAAGNASLPNEDDAADASLNRCFLGIWRARTGDAAKATGDAQALRSLAQRFQQSLWASGASACALTIGLETRTRSGDKGLGTKLDSLNTLMSAGPYVTSQLLWDVMVIESADLLERAGDATRAYVAIQRRNGYERIPPYLAYQLNVEGRLALALGRNQEARAALTHYLALVDRPDRILLHDVGEARKRLESAGR